MPPTYQLRLSRIAFTTLYEDLQEPLGDEVDVAGPRPVPGERRAKGLDLKIMLDGQALGQDVGNRLRRQVRALLSNERARLEGLYFAWDADPEQNGWVVPGTADVVPSEAGVTFGDYRLEASSVYRLGTPRTVRPARRIEVRDRRLPTVPRDVRGTVFSSDFSTQSVGSSSEATLPSGVSDVVGYNGRPYASALAVVPTLSGNVTKVVGYTAGETLHFEQAEADRHKSDVVIFDRQGIALPPGGFTQLGDLFPQTAYGWEEVYGPDQPLTPGDLPALDNGLIRVGFDQARSAIVLMPYVAGSGYVDHGRVVIVNDVLGLASLAAGARPSVVAWTPERGIVRAPFLDASGNRFDVYVTLRRGATGPSIEAYGSTFSGVFRPRLRVVGATAGAASMVRSDGTTATVADGTDYGTFASRENWAALAPGSPNLPLYVAVLVAGHSITGRTTGTLGYGSARTSLEVIPAAGKGYAGVHLGYGPRPVNSADVQGHGRRTLLDVVAIPELVPR